MRQSWKAADRRMNTVNELFQNVRFLKFYGWGEHPFPFPRAAPFVRCRAEMLAALHRPRTR